MASGFDPEGTADTAENDAAENAVTVLKALSHSGRLQILCHLLDRDMAVQALSKAMGKSQTCVSQHLMRLRAQGFVRARRQGKQVFYGLADTRVIPVIQALRHGYCAPAA